MTKNRLQFHSYSTVAESKFRADLNRLRKLIQDEKLVDPYVGLRIVEYQFMHPYLRCAHVDIIVLAVMRVLMKYAYNTGYSPAKFTVGYIMKIPTGDVTYSIGPAISLYDESGNPVPKVVYDKILKLVMVKAEYYDKDVLTGLVIRIYKVGGLRDKAPLSNNEIDQNLWLFMKSGIGEPEEVPSMRFGKRRYCNYMTELKPPRKGERLPFIVADTETVLINKVHVPYAAGFLVVEPSDSIGDMPDYSIETYFSEDDLLLMPEFAERSNKMLSDFLSHLAMVADNTKIRTVYFHNFSRFDGILLLKYYASYGDKYTIKPLMRNLRLYELKVYRGKKLVLCFRDSLNLLPGNLDDLAKTLCPQLGSKGSIAHDKVAVSNLKAQQNQLLDYLRQDIRLLGGVMLKAQEISWIEYQVDIVGCITLSALAMKIYRQRYYDSTNWPLHIPSRNEDAFIRRGYYGGHADTYIPYGENLYYYDVNSLYPFIMKTCNMPGGVPVWNGNLEDKDLSNIYGYIEAFIICPSSINRPFLPYKDHNNTLLFPTGKWIGVYYSEELKFAANLGYKIFPLKGYLLEQKSSPFKGFVSSLFEKRQEAKKAGDEAMSYTYKILMNSLYGRFGINPESTNTEVCSRDRYDYLIQNTNFMFGNKLSEHSYIVSYKINTVDTPNSAWNPPKISAVYISAAVTACARMHMYKYISRPDCYYTDTDSAVLGSPLPEDEVSPFELGKLKQEHEVEKGIFLASKSYCLVTTKSGVVLKHKGIGKEFATEEWFESQLVNLSRTINITVSSNFSIDWHQLNIAKKEIHHRMGVKVDTKRDIIYDSKDIWVGTKPKDVIDYGGQESTVYRLELKIAREELDQIKKENAQRLEQNKKQVDQHILNMVSVYEGVIENLHSKIASQHEDPKNKDETRPVTESPKLEQPKKRALKQAKPQAKQQAKKDVKKQKKNLPPKGSCSKGNKPDT